MDRYLKTQASQDVKRRQATVLVVCEEPGASEIFGYFTITASSMLLTSVPEDVKIPATLVGRLAVDYRYARRGYGSFMLFHAAARAMAPEAPASWALLVDPLDDDAAGWYSRLGFMHLEAPTRRMFIPLATISSAVIAALKASREPG
ncbi:MAG: GNAT family N-acetyltransferase [Candidatus Dormibacteraeota bacterium]|nr:GNAT family N-acetyltransferase [Candidatus Dormibacteraeota bacterium]